MIQKRINALHTGFANFVQHPLFLFHFAAIVDTFDQRHQEVRVDLHSSLTEGMTVLNFSQSQILCPPSCTRTNSRP